MKKIPTCPECGQQMILNSNGKGIYCNNRHNCTLSKDSIALKTIQLLEKCIK